MMRTIRGLGTLGLAALLAGCMSPKRFHPTGTGFRELVPDMGALSETELAELRTTPVAAREPATAGIAWIVDAGGGAGHDALPESERLGLAKRLATALEALPFSTVDVLPTTAAYGGEPDDVALPALRSAAARFRHDLLIVVSTHYNQYDDWNPLALTYLALLPRWFVPGNSLAVYASVEACAIDVRSGFFLACAQGEAKAERALVTAVGRDRGMRELSATALGAALDAIPGALRHDVHARLGRAS